MKFLRLSSINASAALLMAALPLHAWKLEPLRKEGPKRTGMTLAEKARALRPDGVQPVALAFFEEEVPSGGWLFAYPEGRSRIFVTETGAKEGEACLQLDLDPSEWSGGFVALSDAGVDLSPHFATGALRFWVKGEKGGEVAQVALLDGKAKDGKETMVRVELARFGAIDTAWREMAIPLREFGKRGMWWDEAAKREVSHKFEWDAVAQFRIAGPRGANSSFRIWIDGVIIVPDAVAPMADDGIPTLVAAPPAARMAAEEKRSPSVHRLFRDVLPSGGHVYGYGGASRGEVLETASPGNQGVLAMFFDNAHWSGVNFAVGRENSMDLEAIREQGGGIAFWAKGGPGAANFFLSVRDDDSDGKKTQTRRSLSEFGPLDTLWRYYEMPLKLFSSDGMAWSEETKTEFASPMDWRRIEEIALFAPQYGNKVDSGRLAMLFFDDIRVVSKVEGFVDIEKHWAEFRSDAPDRSLHDFEKEIDLGWSAFAGAKSEASSRVVQAPGGKGRALEVEYRIGDWVDASFPYRDKDAPAELRDWTRHWALRFRIYAHRPYQPVLVQIADAGGELFAALGGGNQGWNDILIPFRDFRKYSWQPADAKQNGRLDLQEVLRLSIRPTGEGSRGTYAVDDVVLTNLRGLPRVAPPKEKTVAVRGDLSKTVTQRVNPGLFANNVEAIDTDLLTPKTFGYLKDVRHPLLRYPGGLFADVYHWKESLRRKNPEETDTDEFLALCRKLGAEPMITVNFGKGTPEEAAEWVRYVNVEKRAGVKYWEIGNELYGDWHPDYCTAGEYGRRAAEYLKAMKAEDSSIIVTVVGTLEGDWNETVLAHTGELADGVNVHHYAQGPGEENDQGLLHAPQGLDGLIPSLRKQIAKHGVPGKRYELWISEWNSVAANPGPQTLSLVNGLFLADYLGMLARQNVEQACYWAVHNRMGANHGDHGYLSRTGDAEGDNVPRPSFHAFKLARDALWGRLAECGSEDGNVSCYLAEDGGRKSMLLVNKYPETVVQATLKVPGLRGQAVVRQLRRDNERKGPAEESGAAREGMRLALPPHSLTVISWE